MVRGRRIMFVPNAFSLESECAAECIRTSLGLGAAGCRCSCTLSRRATPAQPPHRRRWRPDFALPAVAGGNVRLSEHRGEVVLLTFWSSRCGQCAGAARGAGSSCRPRTARRDLSMLGVSVDDDHAACARSSHSASGSAFRCCSTGQGCQPGLRHIGDLPTTVLIDRAAGCVTCIATITVPIPPTSRRSARCSTIRCETAEISHDSIL